MNYGAKKSSMMKTPKVLPMSKPSSIERFTGKRTPASMKPTTAAQEKATAERMAKRAKASAAARNRIMTGNYASDN